MGLSERLEKISDIKIIVSDIINGVVEYERMKEHRQNGEMNFNDMIHSAKSVFGENGYDTIQIIKEKDLFIKSSNEKLKKLKKEYGWVNTNNIDIYNTNLFKNMEVYIKKPTRENPIINTFLVVKGKLVNTDTKILHDNDTFNKSLCFSNIIDYYFGKN